VIAEERATLDGATLYRVVPQVAQGLASQCVYVEQGRSGKAGAKTRPLFEQMKRDAAERKFDRLLVWEGLTAWARYARSNRDRLRTCRPWR
jgi:DNA invertase Pin-like site-specific DNA recombinase